MAATGTPEHSWFQVVKGDDLEQGDLLRGIARFIIPSLANAESEPPPIEVQTVDALIVTQSCDLAVRPDGRCRAKTVLLCPVFFKRDFRPEHSFGKDHAWEEARQGRNVFFHVLRRCAEISYRNGLAWDQLIAA